MLEICGVTPDIAVTLQHNGNGNWQVAHDTIDLFGADDDNARNRDNRKCRERE